MLTSPWRRRHVPVLKPGHVNKIVHNDIKPQNILVFEDGCIKISDFGLSTCIIRIETDDTMSPSQSAWNRPLELFNYNDRINPRHSYESDIWAMGFTFYNLATGHFLGNEDDSVTLKTIIMSISVFLDSKWKTHPRFTEELTTLPGLIRSMLAVDKSKRILTSDALNHNIFKDQQLNRPKKPPICIPSRFPNKRIDEHIYNRFRRYPENWPISQADIEAIKLTAHYIFDEYINASPSNRVDDIAVAASSIAAKLHQHDISMTLDTIVGENKLRANENLSLIDLEYRMLKHFGWSIYKKSSSKSKRDS